MRKFTFEVGPGFGTRWAEVKHKNNIIRLLFEMKPGFEDGIGLVYRAIDFGNHYFIKVTKGSITLSKRIRGAPHSIKSVRRSVSYGSHEITVILLGSTHLVIYDSLPIMLVIDSTYTSGNYVGVSFWNAKTSERVTVEVLP